MPEAADTIVENRSHDAILQTLDRQNVNGFYLAREAFEPTVTEWAEVPLIFAKDHPDVTAYDENPSSALEAVDGKIVGSIRAPRIITEGHPTLRATIDINDPAVEALYDAGKLTPSTAFIASEEDFGARKVSTPVKPHHLLLFVEDESNQPGDRGALILNRASINNTMEVEPMPEDDTKEKESIIERLKAFLGIGKKADPTPAPATADVTNTQERKPLTDDKQNEPEQKTDDTASVIANKDAEIAKLAEKVKAFEDAEAKRLADAKWLAFREKLPPGMVHGDAEATSRTEFESDPAGFSLKVIKHVEEQKAAEPAQGEDAQPPAPVEPGLKDELKSRIGVYRNGKWE